MDVLEDLKQQEAYLEEAVKPIRDLLDEERYEYKTTVNPIFQILNLRSEGIAYDFWYLKYTDHFRIKIYVALPRIVTMYQTDTEFILDSETGKYMASLTVPADRKENLFYAVLPYLPGYAAPLEVRVHLKKIRNIAYELEHALDTEDYETADRIVCEAVDVSEAFLAACHSNHYGEEYTGNAYGLLLDQIDRYDSIERSE